MGIETYKGALSPARVTVFSACRRYRYTLWREWDKTLPFIQFIGLNPSTADETQDDPTVRRCIDFAKRWGYGALCMTNIFAWRDTDPEKMKLVPEPIGNQNDDWLHAIATMCVLQPPHGMITGMVIGAWGKHGSHMYRGYKVKRLIPELWCLRKNKDGSPEHPLYLPATLQPIKL